MASLIGMCVAKRPSRSVGMRKTIFGNSIGLIVASSFFCIVATAQAHGGADSGGGDHNAQAFAKIGQDARDVLSTKSGPIQIDLKALDGAIRTTQVEFTQETLSLNSVKKDALNFPKEKKIRVNEQAWDSMSANAKSALVLHEYLGIIGVDDANYVISYQMLDFKPSKIACYVSFRGKHFDDSARLNAEVDDTYDGLRKHDSKNLTIEHDRAGGDDVLLLTWDLTTAYPNETWNGSRPTKVYVKSSKLDGTLQVDLSFDTKDGLYSTTDRTVLNLGLLYIKKNILGQSERVAETSVSAGFPAPNYNLGLAAKNISIAAGIDCRVN